MEEQVTGKKERKILDDGVKQDSRGLITSTDSERLLVKLWHTINSSRQSRMSGLILHVSEREMTYYEVVKLFSEDGKVRRGYAWRSLQKLVHLGIVEVKREEVFFKKRDLKKKAYGLTAAGREMAAALRKEASE